MEQTQTVFDIEKFCRQRNEPAWLSSYREKNFAVFEKKPLKKSQYVNVQQLEGMLNPPTVQKIKFSCSTKGVQVFSLAQALEKFPEKIKAAIEKESGPKDQFEAFINAFFSDGFALFVPESFAGEKIEVQAVLENKSVSKNFLIFENEKKALVFEKISGHGQFAFCENDFLAEQAKAEVCRLHDHAADSSGFFYNQSMVGKDAVFVNSNAWLNGKFLRSNTFNNLVGKGASSKQFDTLLLDGEQLFDLNNTAMHLEQDTLSNTIFKGIMAGKSKSVFDAMIKIVKKAQKSNAFLEAHGMLLSPNASSNNIPGLEIEADDVKASHSASVAQIDDEQVYYIQSRGISKKTALQLIITGFVESVLLNLDPKLSEMIFEEIEKKNLKME